jgi:guanylate kinase
MVNRPPLLIVFSGPSGVGKDTVIQHLRRRMTDVQYAVTATTRPPREGEVDGKSYYFVSQREYDKMLDRGDLLAPAEVHGYWYGAPLERIGEALASGKDVLLKIDVQGAIQVRRRFPQAVFIFLAPVSFDDLVARLEQRRTEFGEELERRISDARFEMDQMPRYDYVVVNRDDDVETAVESVACIITAERLRIHRQPIDLGDTLDLAKR